METPNPTSYDEVPYTTNAHPQTHPDRIAVTAALLGVKPPPLVGSRILELGSASGTNLIAMALTIPGSTFLGIDLSARQVEEGRKTIAALGLTNVELRHLSIMDVTPELGQFDYLICHGIFSWVPRPVQDKILEICARNLSPDGVALVTYNTYPGWHFRGIIREVMTYRYRAKDFDEPLAGVKRARAMVDVLTTSIPQEGAYAAVLRGEAASIRDKPDAYVFHDHMEEINDPVYFHEFAARAMARGLHYLSDLDTPLPASNPLKLEDVLQTLTPSRIDVEQYKDFMANRSFRQTLLALKEVPEPAQPGPEVTSAFLVASAARPTSAKPDLAPNVPERFELGKDTGVTPREPLVKAAMLLLGQAWPGYVPFDVLRVEARKLVSGAPADRFLESHDADELAKFLTTAYARAANVLIRLHLQPPPFAVEVPERPVASPLARLQAATRKSVTNLRLQPITLDDVGQALLTRLDGKHDRRALIKELVDAVSAGKFNVQLDGKPALDGISRLRAVEQMVPKYLLGFARNALLMPA